MNAHKYPICVFTKKKNKTIFFNILLFRASYRVIFQQINHSSQNAQPILSQFARFLTFSYRLISKTANMLICLISMPLLKSIICIFLSFLGNEPTKRTRNLMEWHFIYLNMLITFTLSMQVTLSHVKGPGNRNTKWIIAKESHHFAVARKKGVCIFERNCSDFCS